MTELLTLFSGHVTRVNQSAQSHFGTSLAVVRSPRRFDDFFREISANIARTVQAFLVARQLHGSKHCPRGGA